MSQDSATQAIESLEQNDSVKRANIVAFAIMIVTLLASIIQIITSSTPEVQVTAKIYNDSQVTSSVVSEEPMQDEPININTADLELLITLNGIGEKKAQAIIDYREKNGLFSNIEEIMQVKGIGEKIFESIKDDIKV